MAEEGYKRDVKWGVAVLLFAVLALSGALSPAWNCPVGDQARSAEAACAGYPAPGVEDLAVLTDVLLAQDGWVIVLQLVGIVLVAALIGAIVMSIREREVGQ